MTNVLQVSTTTDSKTAAVELASSAVRARLAACAQIQGPATSVFWHLGEFGVGEEWQVTMKTVAARYAELEAHLVAHHPWEKPEVTAIEVVSGSAAYLDWVRGCVEGQNTVG